jgi:hypothetical protein
MKIGTYEVQPLDGVLAAGLLFLLFGRKKGGAKMKNLPTDFRKKAELAELTVIYTESGSADSVVKANIEANIKRIVKEKGLKKVNFFFTDDYTIIKNWLNPSNGMIPGDVIFYTTSSYSQMQTQQTDVNRMYDYISIVVS